MLTQPVGENYWFKSMSLINFLSKIEWRFTYGVFQGTIERSEGVTAILGNSDSGILPVKSSELSGSQKTKLAWFVDEEYIKFRVLSVTEPT